MKDNKDNELIGEASVGEIDNTPWQSQDLASKSETHLEDDLGSGEAAIIRVFEFAASPEAFRAHTPTRQELFNYHSKGIEVMLWKDGMTVMPDVDPKVTINEKQTKYRIFVGAKPMKGHTLHERPQTLSQIVHSK